MGFMDKFKDVADQAQQAAKSASGSVAGMGGAAGEAAKVNKIATQGVKHPAVLKGMTETSNKDPLSGGTEFQLEVEVMPTGGEAYTASFTQQLIQQSIEGYREKIGEAIVVNVDPDDPNSMMLWG